MTLKINRGDTRMEKEIHIKYYSGKFINAATKLKFDKTIKINKIFIVEREIKFEFK